MRNRTIHGKKNKETNKPAKKILNIFATFLQSIFFYYISFSVAVIHEKNQ